MSSWLPGALGVATLTLLILAILGWIGSRRLLLSPLPTSPLSAICDGWRAVSQTIRVMPLVALLAFTVKLLQIFAYSARDIFVGSSNAGRLWTTVAIELLFTLAWTAAVFQIYLLALAPETPRDRTRGRIWRAVLYALAFWTVSFALTIGGIVWIATLRGPGRQVVTVIFVYLPYLFIIASALTRPAIAIGLPRPFRECRRILRENWFGIAVTLGLAALPLGLLFFSVGLTRQFLHLGVGPALLLEVPIALVSALFYAAFEGAIAEMYKRIG